MGCLFIYLLIILQIFCSYIMVSDFVCMGFLCCMDVCMSGSENVSCALSLAFLCLFCCILTCLFFLYCIIFTCHLVFYMLVCITMKKRKDLSGRVGRKTRTLEELGGNYNQNMLYDKGYF